MLIGGTDVSGISQNRGQQNHVALILGTMEEINKAYNRIGIDGIHMRKLSDSKKEQVRRNMDLSSDCIRAWCFHVGRQHIEYHIRNHERYRAKISLSNMHKNFDIHWLRLFRSDLEEFVTPFKTEMREIVVQTDRDMKSTINNWHMKGAEIGKAHELADAIAWFNQTNVRIDHCKMMDLRGGIRNGMEQDLLK